MKEKWLAIGIILLFVGTCIIPSVTSEQTYDKNIITVDDEPGDADFTSIKEAVNSSSPGDTIEVYSGTYPEQEICIVKDNVTLLGVAHELGGGNDSGKPLIQGHGNGRVLRVEASYVVVSNFRIEHPGAFSSICISVHEQNNITISDCIIHSSKKEMNDGIQVGKCNNTRIINNDISNCSCGILASSQSPGSLTITGNVVTDCTTYGGITLYSNQQNVSGNRIRRCDEGIRIFGTNNTIFGNDIDNCPISVCSPAFYGDEVERGNTFIKNNFKNYSREPWWDRQVILFPFYGFVKDKKDRWIGNYWDTWVGVGPKGILGWLGLGIGYDETGIGFIIPWFEYDRYPAKEPYDIPGMR